MASDKTSPPPQTPASSPLRWMILAVFLVAISWFGIRALRETPEVGAAGDAEGGSAPAGPPPATVMLQPVQKVAARESRQVTGTLRAMARADVAARETGAVEEVLVNEGDAVKKGDTLAILDRRRLDAEIAETKARITAAEAVLTQRNAEAERATTDLQRKKTLSASGAVSEREYLDAKRESSVANAGVAAATNELAAVQSSSELLDVRSDDVQIIAPFDGRVVARHVEPGEWLAAGQAVITLVSSGDIEAWLNVPERFIADIGEDTTDLKILSNSSGLSSPVKKLQAIGDVDPITRLFPVVATIDDLDGKMFSGMAVEADLPVGKNNQHLAIPVDALVVARGEAFVFRPRNSGPEQLPIAEKVVVRELFRGGGFVFVDSDLLKKEDSVVTEGNERLFPGTPLMIAPTPESPAQSSEQPSRPSQIESPQENEETSR